MIENEHKKELSISLNKPSEEVKAEEIKAEKTSTARVYAVYPAEVTKRKEINVKYVIDYCKDKGQGAWFIETHKKMCKGKDGKGTVDKPASGYESRMVKEFADHFLNLKTRGKVNQGYAAFKEFGGK